MIELRLGAYIWSTYWLCYECLPGANTQTYLYGESVTKRIIVGLTWTRGHIVVVAIMFNELSNQSCHPEPSVAGFEPSNIGVSSFNKTPEAVFLVSCDPSMNKM